MLLGVRFDPIKVAATGPRVGVQSDSSSAEAQFGFAYMLELDRWTSWFRLVIVESDNRLRTAGALAELLGGPGRSGVTGSRFA